MTTVDFSKDANLVMRSTKNNETIVVTLEVGISQLLKWECDAIRGRFEIERPHLSLLRACVVDAAEKTDQKDWLAPTDRVIESIGLSYGRSGNANTSANRTKLNTKIRQKLQINNITIRPLIVSIPTKGISLSH